MTRPPPRPGFERCAQGGEQGQVTAFTALITATLLLFAGLVVDGGLTLSARLHALNDAQAAARAAAQALDLAAYRQDGRVVLDPARARALALAHLSAAGDTGEVTVAGDRVTVTARRTQPMQVFTLVGISSQTVTATASAVAQRGAAAPEPT